MKKIAWLLVVAVLLPVFPAVAADTIDVNIDGELYDIEPAPLVIDEHVMVPMRPLFEALEAHVEWEPEARIAVGKRDDVEVRIPIDSNIATVNGVETNLTAPATIIDGYTFIPYSFIGKALGDNIWWDEASRTVFLSRVTEPDIEPIERAIEPVVSTDWLEENADLDDLIILDIRSEDEYEAGHIPNAINIPAEAFWTMRDELAMELPDESDLFNIIGDSGITNEARVVIVGTTPEPPAPPYALAQATRVAVTLIYAGVDDVAILDGGYTKWIAEEKPVTEEVPEVESIVYEGQVKQEMIVSRQYVEQIIQENSSKVIIDTRDADVYFGVTIEPFADKAGHIPTAKSLPTPWMWNEDWTYKNEEVLQAMASGVIDNGYEEHIIYCGVGGYASSWWFVLTQMLGYENVKIYNGSAQEWVRYNDMVPYKWE